MDLSQLFDKIIEKVTLIRDASEDALSLLEKGLITLNHLKHEAKTPEIEEKMLRHLVQFIKEVTAVLYELDKVKSDYMRL
jgi:hypothetical protein